MPFIQVIPVGESTRAMTVTNDTISCTQRLHKMHARMQHTDIDSSVSTDVVQFTHSPQMQQLYAYQCHRNYSQIKV